MSPAPEAELLIPCVQVARRRGESACMARQAGSALVRVSQASRCNNFPAIGDDTGKVHLSLESQFSPGWWGSLCASVRQKFRQ